MSGATSDVWETMSTARAIRRFTDEPVDDATLTRCLEAATWAPSGANAQAWHFIVLRSPEQRAIVAKAAAQALEVVEPAGHVVVGWPKGKHGPVRRRPLAEIVNLDHWDQPYLQQEKRSP
jgi:nitroreductase